MLVPLRGGSHRRAASRRCAFFHPRGSAESLPGARLSILREDAGSRPHVACNSKSAAGPARSETSGPILTTRQVCIKFREIKSPHEELQGSSLRGAVPDRIIRCSRRFCGTGLSPRPVLGVSVSGALTSTSPPSGTWTGAFCISTAAAARLLVITVRFEKRFTISFASTVFVVPECSAIRSPG